MINYQTTVALFKIETSDGNTWEHRGYVNLFGTSLFVNPKDHHTLARLEVGQHAIFVGDAQDKAHGVLAIQATRTE